MYIDYIGKPSAFSTSFKRCPRLPIPAQPPPTKRPPGLGTARSGRRTSTRGSSSSPSSLVKYLRVNLKAGPKIRRFRRFPKIFPPIWWSFNGNVKPSILSIVRYPLVNVYIANWNIAMFNGKIHYEWSFSIAMLNYQRVNAVKPSNHQTW